MKRITLLVGGLLPLVTFAHPGHGSTEGFTIIHYMLEPVHLVPLMIVSFAGCVLYKKHQQKKNKA